MQRIKNSNTLLLLLYARIFKREFRSRACYTTTVDMIEPFTNEPLQRIRPRDGNHFVKDFSLRYFMEMDSERSAASIANMTKDEKTNYVQNLISKNNHKQITIVLRECIDKQISLGEYTLKKLFRNYSILGKVNMVELLQQYSLQLEPCLYRRNGEFLHYIAKAQCMRGNSDKGLAILKLAYIKYDNLRNFYRLIFRELINDSISNRSEASLVIFKNYVLEFSNKWNDNYPLICFWHCLWSSTWFSDQMLSNDLLESCPVLQKIVWDRATAFSINILKQYNEDAVVRLLQSLLKYGMMTEYAKVLQILFGYKLKNRDLRGCTEIIKNCKVLNISLPSYQQGRYIQMLIHKHPDVQEEKSEEKNNKTEWKNFKMKF